MAELLKIKQQNGEINLDFENGIEFTQVISSNFRVSLQKMNTNYLVMRQTELQDNNFVNQAKDFYSTQVCTFNQYRLGKGCSMCPDQ